MIKVACLSCAAPYELDERRLPASGLRMRCPKCGTSFQVFPDARVEPAAAAPTPKKTQAGIAPPTAAPPPASSPLEDHRRVPRPAGQASDLEDLPAPRGAVRASSVASDADLPAPRTAMPKPIAPPARAIPPAPAAPRAPIAPAFAPPPATSGAADDLDLDLPAPRSAVKPPAPAAPPRPPIAATAPTDDLDLDLPAPRGAVPKKAPVAPALRAAPAHVAAPARVAAPTSQDDLDLDLPAARGAARKPLAPSFRPAGHGSLDLDLDLPAPRGASPKPPAARTPALADASRTPFDDDADLPAVRSDGGAELPAPKGGGFDLELDLPAPRVRTGAQTPGVLAAADDAFGDLDLPMPKSAGGNHDGGFGDLDLPAPRRDQDLPMLRGDVDLPALHGLDLPSPRGVSDLPALHDHADFPASLGASDLPTARGPADLPMPRPAQRGGGLPALGADFGDLELPLPSARESAAHDDLELPLPPAHGGGGRGHGEVDLGGGGGAHASSDDMEFADIPQSAGGTSDPGSITIGRASREPANARATKTPAAPRRSRTPFVVLGTLVVLIGAGAALGFTPLGPFGSYAIEGFLPGAGDPAAVRAVVAEADELALHDVREDSWTALRQLAGARASAGLNRALLARSLMHEALFEVRFGAREGGAATAAAIRERLVQRQADDPQIALGLAALELSTGDMGGASRRVAAARTQDPADPFVDLIDGEIALAEDRWSDAAQSFRASLEHGGGAAAQWGLTRALMRGDDAALLEAAIDATLSASPRHAGARNAKARMLWDRSDEDGAILLAREVVGAQPVGDEALRASAADRADAFALLGRIHERRGRTHQAREAYEAAIDEDGRRVEALLGAGRTLLADQPRNALGRFESVLEVESAAETRVEATGRSARDEARLGAARAKLVIERAEEARTDLESLASELPDDAEVALWLGRVEAQLSHADAAEQHFRDAVRLAPDSFDGYLALARLYGDQDRGADALAVLEQARARVAESAEMRQSLGNFELSRNRLPEAIRELRRALELDAELPGASFGLGVALRRSGQLDEAEAVFDRLSTLDAGHPGLALERGLLYEARGQSDRAVSFYQAALTERPDDAELLLRLGAAQVAANQIDAASETLERVQRMLPNSPETEHFLGRVAFARNNLPEASAHFERAIALDATRGEFYLYAAWAALEERQLGRALERVRQAIERDPSLGDAYWIRGAVNKETGAVRDALVDLQHALQLKPERVEALALMAECYDQLRQLPQAIAAYERAVAARDSNGQWWYRLGQLRLDSSQRADAARALARATLLGDATTPQPGWLADAHRLQGDALRLGGERGSAVEHYRRYLEIAPSGAIDRAEVRRAMMDLGAVPPEQ